jgi:pimeloyl-ACP methyl ester carboxylesterase
MHGRLGAFLRARGYAVLLVDMPGVGESPVRAGPDAERQWTPIFDWLATRDDLERSGARRRAGPSAAIGP